MVSRIKLNIIAKYHTIVSRIKLNIIAKYHTVGIKNQTKPNYKISHKWYQESNLTKMRNITKLVSRIKFNKIAKYHKIQVLTKLKILQKHQTQHNPMSYYENKGKSPWDQSQTLKSYDANLN